MKTKFFLSAIAVMSLLFLALFSIEKSETSDYSSRDSQLAEQGFRGAAEHYAMLRQNLETGEMDPADHSKMMKAVRRHNKSSVRKELGLDMTWQTMGPTNYGGRTRDVCITEGGVVYAGGVSGGLFVSWDSGNTWFRNGGLKENLNVAAVEEAGNGTLFVGTGSLFDGAGGVIDSGFLGSGVYKSNDEGVTWSRVEGLAGDPLSGGINSATDILIADKNDPNRMWIGGAGGLRLYDDVAGEIINGEASSPFDGISNGDNNACGDMVVSEDGNRMLVVLGTTVFLSSNGGDSWIEVSGNDDDMLPTPPANRVGLAISPEDPNYVYALLSYGGRMGGVYASTDGGNAWFSIWPENVQNGNIDIDPFGDNRQGGYDLCITVFPNDKEKILVGGVTLWQGGLNNQPERIASNSGFGTNYVHSDLHHFEWDGNVLYVACDGGIFKSTDIATTENASFVESNFGYTTTQFYGIGISTTGKVNGGTQDQSSFIVTEGNTNAVNVFGGDGFDSDFSAVDDNCMFVTSQYASLGRSFDGGQSFEDFYSGDLEALRQTPEQNFPFHSNIRLFENTDDEFSQRTVIYARPTGSDPIFVGDDVTVRSNNLDQNIDVDLDGLVLRTDTTAEDSFTITLDEFENSSTYLDTFIVVGLDQFDVVLPTNDNSIEIDTTIVGAEVTFEISIPVNAGFTLDLEPYLVIDGEGNVTDTLERPALPVEFTVEVNDPYTSLFVVYSFEGIFVTRDALDANAAPIWIKILNGNFGINAMEFSEDGNHLFLGSGSGDLYRVSGFNYFWNAGDVGNLATTRILRANGPITGIGPDSKNIDRLAVSIGGYGGSSKVLLTEVATTAEESSNTSNFSNIWFTNGDPLTGMPCYDVIISSNQADGNDVIFVGTEFGVWGTKNIADNNAWEQCSRNIGNVPVFAIRQQYRGEEKYINPTNEGEIYIGTHGRGIFSASGREVSVEELTADVDRNGVDGLFLFPNPASETVSFEVNLNRPTDLVVKVFSITGKEALNQNLGNVSAGVQVLPLYVGELPSGNYLVNITGEGFNKTGKLLVK